MIGTTIKILTVRRAVLEVMVYRERGNVIVDVQCASGEFNRPMKPEALVQLLLESLKPCGIHTDVRTEAGRRRFVPVLLSQEPQEPKYVAGVWLCTEEYEVRYRGKTTKSARA